MIKVNFRDGSTVGYDLEVDRDFRAWQQVMRDPLRLRQITGMQIQIHGVTLALPRPKEGSRYRFGAEALLRSNGVNTVSGERIFCQFRDHRLDILAYTRSKLIRVDLSHTGIQRFDPINPIDGVRQ